jgi:ABC-2 type transport system ATP-binding protein/lipopolysaccharide transport system ATP-binding protein
VSDGSTDPRAVVLDNVSLCYRLARQRIPSIKEYALHWVRGALIYQELWALQDISISLGPGDRLGVVGANGAGKSSLLKVISGVIKPTRGRAQVQGRIAPILELGIGFDYELTGIENAYLNALFLGHSRKDVDAHIDDIVEFSGLGDFVHSPVRTYSSGMLARLGFAVVTAWTPDVLLLDEVLAVGDVHFVKKCEARLERFHAAGTTLVFVSHSPEAIRRNCNRCAWLDKGRLRALGTPDEILPLYTGEAGGA